MEIIKGKAWVFGDNLDVDFEIVPYRIVNELELGSLFDNEESRNAYEETLGQYCMTAVDPEFPKKVRKGDVIVAGTNMGCGHDHATGPQAIKGCGVKAVIAESLTDWFLRNCINVGLPAIQYEGIKQKVKEGDELEIDIREGNLTNLTTNKTFEFKPLPEFLLEIIEAGGLIPHLKKKVENGELCV